MMVGLRMTSLAMVLLFSMGQAVTWADELAPSPTPVAWELTFEPGIPARIVADLGNGPQTYWYMVYTVVNNTGEDVAFHPLIARVNEIETEVPAAKADEAPQKASSMTVDPAIVGAHPTLFRAIQERHAKTHPFMVSPIKAIGTLRQGKDNALTSVAIFPALDPRVSKFTIYVGGLSGERLTKRNPLFKGDAGNGDNFDSDDVRNQKYFVLQKTLAMPFALPGDEGTRASAAPVLGRMIWVMR